MDTELRQTPIERLYLNDGSTRLLSHARHQHFLNGTLFVGSPVNEETFEVPFDEHVMVRADTVSKRVAIGQAPDGSYHEAPQFDPWSDRL